MEINQINNSKAKLPIADFTISFLLREKLITEEMVKNVNIQFGYLFSKHDGVLEGLLKAVCDEQVFYFAVQDNGFSYININEQQYIETIENMRKWHECIASSSTSETEKQKNRRTKNNNHLTMNNISVNENLFCCINDSDVEIKRIDEVCKRAIACLLTTQIACDINKGDYEQSLKFFLPMYKKFGVENSLNSKEIKIINGTYNRQDAIDMDWAYEAYWALCWCLGLVDSIEDASVLCDCNKAISLVSSCESFEEFKEKCKIRSLEEILDMHDLYYRYNWAINHKQINNTTRIGNLNPSNVIERRRALEWIISQQNDWYDISLDT